VYFALFQTFTLLRRPHVHVFPNAAPRRVGEDELIESADKFRAELRSFIDSTYGPEAGSRVMAEFLKEHEKCTRLVCEALFEGLIVFAVCVLLTHT
jgi:hypothetical protein